MVIKKKSIDIYIYIYTSKLFKYLLPIDNRLKMHVSFLCCEMYSLVTKNACIIYYYFEFKITSISKFIE